MICTSINVQLSKCPKQYESVRLGGEWTIGLEEDAKDAIKRANQELLDVYNELYCQPATKPAPAKPVAPKPVAQAPAPAKPAEDPKAAAAAAAIQEEEALIGKESETKAPESAAPQAPAVEEDKNGGEGAKAKEPLTFADPKLQKIIKRIEKGTVTLEKVLEYYEPDTDAMKALELAIKLCK